MKIYLPQVNKLVRSILIKSSHQAVMINNNIVKKYGSSTVSEDPTTWRYYLNINGEYHTTNIDMEIYVLELAIIMPLTKELLEAYPKTKADLELFSDRYNALVAKYPNNELLIRGMINPIPYDVASSANDGKILYYSKYYVTDREVNIISKLSKYTESIYYRWFNEMYINMSSYYVAVFLSYLYSTLSIKIEMYRFENIHTHRVSDYHLEKFFNANLDVDTTYMNHTSKFWLYQNLRTIMNNTGKDEALEELIDNVLTPNIVGVGKLLIRKAKPIEIEANQLDSTKPAFSTNNITQLMVEPKNNLYYSDGLTVSEVINMEIESGYIHSSVYNELTDLVTEVSSKLQLNNEIVSDTKVLHLLGKEERDILPFPRVNMVLDNLFYISKNSTNEFFVTYTDVNTNITYTIMFNDAIRLLGYYLLKLGGIDNTSITIGSTSIIKKNYVDVINLMLDDNTDKTYIDTIRGYRPVLFNSNFNTEYIVDYINASIKYFSVDWIIKSSLTNQVSVGNMLVYDKYNHSSLITIDIGDIVSDIGLTSVDGYDYLSGIKALISAMTNGNINLDISEVSGNVINSYVDLVKKTTSYNVQVIGSTIASNSINMFDVNIGLLSGKTIASIKSSFINGFEDLIADLEDNPLSRVYQTRTSGGIVLTESMLMDNVGYGLVSPSFIPFKRYPLELSDDVIGLRSDIINMNDTVTANTLTLGEGLGIDGTRTSLTKPVTITMDETDTMYSGVTVIYDNDLGDF